MGVFIITLMDKKHNQEVDKREYELALRNLDLLQQQRMAIIERLEVAYLDKSLSEIEREIAKENKEIN